MCLEWLREGTHNGYFSAELVLDLAFLEGIWTLLFDDGEELLNTHLCGLETRLLVVRFRDVVMGKGIVPKPGDAIEVALLREEAR